jgi:hypothetical protein
MQNDNERHTPPQKQTHIPEFFLVELKVNKGLFYKVGVMNSKNTVLGKVGV